MLQNIYEHTVVVARILQLQVNVQTHKLRRKVNSLKYKLSKYMLVCNEAKILFPVSKKTFLFAVN